MCHTTNYLIKDTFQKHIHFSVLAKKKLQSLSKDPQNHELITNNIKNFNRPQHSSVKPSIRDQIQRNANPSNLLHLSNIIPPNKFSLQKPLETKANLISKRKIPEAYFYYKIKIKNAKNQRKNGFKPIFTTNFDFSFPKRCWHITTSSDSAQNMIACSENCGKLKEKKSSKCQHFVYKSFDT